MSIVIPAERKPSAVLERKNVLQPCPRLASVALLAAAATGWLPATGCQRASADQPAPRVAASSTYLAAAARDLLGADEPVLELAEPGTCPGHFDLRPSQVTKLRACRVLLRFDFQSAWDAKLADLAAGGLRIAPITAGGGLCVPDTYLGVCRQVALAFEGGGLLSHAQAEARLNDISDRLRQLTTWTQEQVTAAELPRRTVLTSRHQADFCRFLGLNVVGVFNSPDAASVQEINQAICTGKGVWLVIANEPEGTDLADALADRLAARLVVFANFPAADEHGGRFDELVRSNVRRLLAAARP
jgi:ABC-type Zn uptake system ZnuABC Zn-binding protein ZnuA